MSKDTKPASLQGENMPLREVNSLQEIFDVLET